MSEPFTGRRQELQAELRKRRLTHLLVTQPANWFYLTGFTGEAGMLVLSQHSSTLITDGRFTAQAKKETLGVRSVGQKGSLADSVGVFLSARGGRVGFDPGQLTVGQLQLLRRAAGTGVAWAEATGYVEAQRAQKEHQEVVQMQAAATLAGDVLMAALKLLKPGIRELEVAAEIDYQMRYRGAGKPAFETIVAFGEHSAYPHARPTAKRLKKNELVVLDLGAILGHYCSDITRTVFVGRAPARIRRWHRAVQEARSAAVAAVRAGVSCGEVDAAARRVLAGHRLERYFVHSTGHGLGLEVHEEPRVARGQKQQLVPGNVITIEPGVYIPDIGGIRIEDDVAVLAGGAQILTSAPRELIEI